MANAVINVLLAVDRDPATMARVLTDEQGTDHGKLCKALSKQFAAAAGGVRSTRVRCMVESSTAGSNQDMLESATPTITITFAGAANGEDAVRIGGVVFAWATAAANENQVTIGANLAAATTNLTAAINVHSKLRGIVSASGNTSTGVITLTFYGSSRMATLMYLAAIDTNSIAVSASSFDGDTTDAYQADAVTHRKGL